MTFANGSNLSQKIRRAYNLHGHYFLNEAGGWVPLHRSQMADSVYTLVESNANAIVGAQRYCSWAPLTVSLLAFYNMMPDKPAFETGPDGTTLLNRVAE